MADATKVVHVDGIGDFPVPVDPSRSAYEGPGLTDSVGKAQWDGFKAGAHDAAVKTLTPETVGGVVGLIPHPAAKIASPIVAALTSIVRDEMGVNGEKNGTSVAGGALGHAALNTIPLGAEALGSIGAGGRIASAATGAASGSGMAGRAVNAVRGLLSGGAPAAAASSLGDLATATLPGGAKVVSPEGLKLLVQKSVELENQLGAAHPTVQAIDALVGQVRSALHTTPTGSALLSKVGLPTMSGAQATAGRIANALRAALAGASVAREGMQ